MVNLPKFVKIQISSDKEINEKVTYTIIKLQDNLLAYLRGLEAKIKDLEKRIEDLE